MKHNGRPVEMVNRIYVDRPLLFAQDKPHTLNQYLRNLETYQPRTLDAASLRQLVSAYEAKAAGRGGRQADIRPRPRG